MRDVGHDILAQSLAKLIPLRPNLQALTLSGVQYRASHQVQIDIPDLDISGRGISVLLGPNGAGKSLFVRLMHGLIAPHAGRIDYDGQSVSGRGRKAQAMVFQKPVLLRRSVVANLKFALKFSDTPKTEVDDKISALLELSGLSGKRHQAARSLSGGEEQCLALACALARSPKMLFLDEPTSSLDPNATHRIEAILHQAALLGVRIVMVSHSLAQAKRLADEVLFMADGKLHDRMPASDFFEGPTSVAAHMFLSGQLVP